MRARFLALWLVAFWGTACAEEVDQLFEEEVLIAEVTPEAREAAIKEALEIVLGRIVAGNAVPDDPTVKTVLRHAKTYVREAQYALLPTAAAASTKRLMRVVFNEAALLELMRNSPLGIWNEIRPATLVWLVVERDGQRNFFKTETQPDIEAALHRAARRKGLPLLFPLMDLEEQRSVSFNDVLGVYSERLLAISARYDVVSILAGLVSQDASGCWRAEWSHYFDGRIEQWPGQCERLDIALLSGMQGVYARLSNYYAVKPTIGEAGSVTLRIHGMQSMNDLSTVQRYLEAVPGVQSVRWLSAEDDRNLYKLHFQGERRTLEQALDLGTVLRRISSSAPHILEYRLLAPTAPR